MVSTNNMEETYPDQIHKFSILHYVFDEEEKVDRCPIFINFMNPVTSFRAVTFSTSWPPLLKPYLRKKQPASFHKHERSIFSSYLR